MDRWRDGAVALGCCAIVLICIFVANPFADAGFDDDWSYTHVALRFAETGRIYYNGWGSPTLLFQSVWGALWIHVFGFSFNVLRMATVPFSLGFVFLVYFLGRKIGLSRVFACFGALCVGTSPLFLPLAASFMTEPYACFFSTLCVYAAIASAEASEPSLAVAWLWVLAVSGTVGGTDRQTVWMAPIVLIPYLFWIKRGDRRFALNAALGWAVCLISIAVVLANFRTPYEPLELSKLELVQIAIRKSPKALEYITSALLSCGLVSLPSLLPSMRSLKGMGEVRILFTGIASTCLVALLIICLGGRGVAPFVGNILTDYGIMFPGQDALGAKPKLLHDVLRVGLTWLLVFATLVLIWVSLHAKSLLLPVPRSVLFMFACSCLPGFVPGALVGLTYDRYVLPLLPLVVLLALSQFEDAVQQIPMSSWVCFVLFAGYAVATTHDYAATLRSHISVAAALQRQGVERRSISAGLEYDGWTQLRYADKIHAPRTGDRFHWNTVDTFWLWDYTDALTPDYVVENAGAPPPSDNRLPASQVLAWTPPFRRWAVAVKRSDLTNHLR